MGTGYQVPGGTFYLTHLNVPAKNRISYDDLRPAYCAQVFWDRHDRQM